jgi:hypothetical protein
MPRGVGSSRCGLTSGGVGAVYPVTAGGYSALWVTVGYVAVTLGTVGWHWYAVLPTGNANASA